MPLLFLLRFFAIKLGIRFPYLCLLFAPSALHSALSCSQDSRITRLTKDACTLCSSRCRQPPPGAVDISNYPYVGSRMTTNVHLHDQPRSIEMVLPPQYGASGPSAKINPGGCTADDATGIAICADTSGSYTRRVWAFAAGRLLSCVGS